MKRTKRKSLLAGDTRRAKSNRDDESEDEYKETDEDEEEDEGEDEDDSSEDADGSEGDEDEDEDEDGGTEGAEASDGRSNIEEYVKEDGKTPSQPIDVDAMSSRQSTKVRMASENSTPRIGQMKKQKWKETTKDDFDPRQETLGCSDQIDEYAILSGTSESWHRTLKLLGTFLGRGWAQCSAEELVRRQTITPKLLSDILNLLGFATGSEIYATGAMMAREGGQSFDMATPRAERFLQTKEGAENRTRFTHYVSSYIGEGLCNSVACPAPAVYPDTARSNHPTFPVGDIESISTRRRLLHDYLSLQLQWQGGSAHVPYGLIKEDFKQGAFSIVKKEAIPDDIEYLKDPSLMTEAEASSMIAHLIAGDSQDLPAGREFRFNRWTKGSTGINEVHTGLSETTYRQDALSFVNAMQTLQSRITASLPPSLGPIPLSSLPYQSLSDVAVDIYCRTLPPSDSWWTLQEALKYHDQLHPIAASDEHWVERSSDFPYLRSSIPLPESAGDHLVADKGYLPVQCFNWRDHDHAKWKLTNALDWCAAENWTDADSDTLLGGPSGIKWPVIVLGHLRRNASRFREEHDKWAKHYSRFGDINFPGVSFEFDEDQLVLIEESIESLRDHLLKSTELLRSFHEARVESRLDKQVMVNSQLMHSNFPTESGQFALKITRPSIMNWDVRGRIVESQ
ncbi:unnamed protein product [Rhizoctonia solani]|uniref:Uncharacterized protein n=1 Tax=Rhizoctonia solani TaxID=456999 RepID=A0A8H3AUL1_9AGAM|nr:unnamed protein product [Rhizoctonia solani]